jgi:uncharacterized protein YjiS (DUF1127 family)
LRQVTSTTQHKEPVMNIPSLLSTFAAWWQRLPCRLHEAQRLRRDLAELRQMDAHELRDLGLSHASVAAATPHQSCCA